jgi:hypothetical protein
MGLVVVEGLQELRSRIVHLILRMEDIIERGVGVARIDFQDGLVDGQFVDQKVIVLG